MSALPEPVHVDVLIEVWECPGCGEKSEGDAGLLAWVREWHVCDSRADWMAGTERLVAQASTPDTNTGGAAAEDGDAVRAAVNPADRAAEAGATPAPASPPCPHPKDRRFTTAMGIECCGACLRLCPEQNFADEASNPDTGAPQAAQGDVAPPQEAPVCGGSGASPLQASPAPAQPLRIRFCYPCAREAHVGARSCAKCGGSAGLDFGTAADLQAAHDDRTRANLLALGMAGAFRTPEDLTGTLRRRGVEL